jgi:hypothetical protein
MDTLRVYWLALKVWFGGAEWKLAYAYAVAIIFWSNMKKPENRRYHA